MGINDLITFLIQATVFFISLPSCCCGREHQTANHVLITGTKYANSHYQLRDEHGDRLNILQLLETEVGFQKTTNWVMQRESVGQFGGTKEDLYNTPTLLFYC